MVDLESVSQKLFQWLNWTPLKDAETTVLGNGGETGLSGDGGVAKKKRYEILRTLGKGAFGVVLLARDHRLGRLVAIKQLNREYVGNRIFVQRFLLEAKIAGQLDHPHIVTIFDVVDDDYPRIFMEYLGGGSLATVTKVHAPLPPHRAIQYILSILDGLQAAHKLGVVHRDLKPSNILFDQRGNLKITDFGIAYLPRNLGGLDENGEVLGTPEYMAPEQLDPKSTSFTPSTDLYSVGLIFYELLTGQRYHRLLPSKDPEHIRQQLLSRALPSFQDFPGNISPILYRMIIKLLQPDPQHRYATCEQVIRKLKVLQRDYQKLTQPSLADPENTREVRKAMYRGLLQLFLKDGMINDFERQELIKRAHRLELEGEVAREIEEEVRKEYQLPSLKDLQHFKWRVEQLLQDRDFSDDDRKILMQLANGYKISEKEAQAIILSVMIQLKMINIHKKE